MKEKGIVSKLTLVSRYWLISSSQQLSHLLRVYEGKPESLKGAVIFLDCNARYGKKLFLKLGDLLMAARNIGLTVILVRNENISLDKRLDLRVTHRSKLMTKLIEEKWEEIE